MPIERNEYNLRSSGGTELSMGELTEALDPEVLDKFQVIPSRFRGIKDGLIPIYWVHDTADDPEMDHLADGGWDKFKKIVFVSNWQMQKFIDRFGIPWSKCVVLPNAVKMFPVPSPLEVDGTVRFVYHTTPHRGLDVLVSAFDALSKTEDVHLDVYSSFSIYGWPEADSPFSDLFEFVRRHPKMTYHGAKPNAEVRSALSKTHSFVYPSTWPETGCRALIEAMMAGCVCSVSNFGCLYETAADNAFVFQYHEDKTALASRTYSAMKDTVDTIRGLGKNKFNDLRKINANRASSRFSWDRRAVEWNSFLKGQLK